jgi:predicted ATPase/energy-coupling factor transporter ATP-binding protein EcfA2
MSTVENRFEVYRSGRQAALLGRDDDLAILQQKWRRAKSGEGQFVLITGEAGIGKSRLARALQERLRPEPHTEISYHCSPFHQDSAFYPIISQLFRAAKIEKSDSAATQLDKLEKLLGPSSSLEDVTIIAALLSIPGGAKYPVPMLTPQRLKESTLEALRSQLTRLVARHPVLVVFEDLHWIDPTTLDFIARTLNQMGSERIMIVATARPEFSPPWGTSEVTSILKVSRLDKAQTESVVSGVAGGRSLPPEIVEQIVTRADGVPLFIEELTKTVLDSGLLRDVDGSYERADTRSHMAIPSTLRASLLARLDRFPEAKEVAQVAAVIGRDFAYSLISKVSGMPTEQLGRGISALVDAELIYRHRFSTDPVYQFKHALVRDAAYDMLLKQRRHNLHAKIAQVLKDSQIGGVEESVLAYHYSNADLPNKASINWLAAGRGSLRKFALMEAIRQLRLGLAQVEYLPDGDERNRREIDIQLCLGNALIQAKGLACPDADHAFKRAYDLRTALQRPRNLMPVLFGILVVKLIGGRPRDALKIAHEMLASAGGDRQSELIANTMLFDIHFWLGKFKSAEKFLIKSRELYDVEADTNLTSTYSFDMKMVALVYASHLYWIRGYPEKSRKAKQMADAWARKLNSPFMHAFTLIWGSAYFHYCGGLAEHHRQIGEGTAIAKRVGFPFFVAQAEIWLAWNRATSDGVDDEVLALFNSGIDEMHRNGAGAALPYFRALHAQAMHEKGDDAHALLLVREASRQVDAFGEASHAAEIHRIRALILTRVGIDEEDAERAFKTSLAIASRQQAKSWELRTTTCYAKWLRARGRRPEALALLQPVYAWFTEGFDTRDLIEAKELLEQLANTT